MAIIGGTALTYADWAKRMDDDGKVATIRDFRYAPYIIEGAEYRT